MARPVPPRRPLFAFALACLVLGAACGRSRPPSVVLILVDTLRWDHLGCAGFPGPISPAVDALAGESVLFEHCHAAAPWTKPSVASLFTSLNPLAHGVTNHDGKFWGGDAPDLKKGELRPEARTLAEAFRDLGYATAAVVSNAWITADYGFDQGFDTFDDSVVGLGTPADSVIAAAESWLDTRPSDRPFFLYLHFMDVHGPYHAPAGAVATIRDSTRFPPDVTLTYEDMQRFPGELTDSPWVWDDPDVDHVNTWRAHYAAGMRALDDRLGPFLDRLRRSGVLDGSYLVLTADHGEELFEHGGWSHGRTLYEENLRVPLIVRPPGGGAPRRVSQVVGLVDLFPTLIARCGGPPPDNVVGRDLSPLLEGATVEGGGVVLSTGIQENPGAVALVAGRHKLLLDPVKGVTALFDLVDDPGETTNLAADHPEIMKRMTAYLGHLAQAGQNLFDAHEVVLSDARRELLESLGYTN